MERVINYGEKIIWSTGNIPTVYEVELYEEDGTYFLSAELRKGTSIENFTEDEKEIFQKVLNLENRNIDFEHAESKKYHGIDGQVHTLKFKINVK